MHALLILVIKFFKNYLQKEDQEVSECWMVNGLFENCVKIVIFNDYYRRKIIFVAVLF